MEKQFKTLFLLWLISLTAGILKTIIPEEFFFNMLTISSALILSFFYFYFSPAYFLQIPISSSLFKELFSLPKKNLIISFFLGIPFSLLALSVITLIIDFMGGILLYSISVITGLVAIFLINSLFGKNFWNIKFVKKNFKLFILLSCLILIIIILNWSTSVEDIQWIQRPDVIPGM